MNLKKTLSKDTLKTELSSTDKSGVLEELVDILVDAGKVNDGKGALKAIIEREKKMSTGMQNGIAIPHAKTDIVDGLVAAVGLSREGIDFDALDGQPSRIFVMTLSPAQRAGPHIQFLAEISRLLNDAAVREKVLNALDKEELLDILSASD